MMTKPKLKSYAYCLRGLIQISKAIA